MSFLKAKVNIVDNDGMSALMYATKRGHLEIIELLINHGAKLNIQEKKYGLSCLHFAVIHDQAEAARYWKESSRR